MKRPPIAPPGGPGSAARPDTDASSSAEARREVEAEFEELGDLETGPRLPSTTLAAHAVLRRSSADGPSAPVGAATSSLISREILRLSWPVMLSQALISVAGLVDRAMIGRLGGEAGSAVPLAAVGYATQLFFLIQSALFAVGLACVALMARSIGAGDSARAREVLVASLQVAVGVTLAFTVGMLIAPRPLLGILGAAPDVVDAGLSYLRLVVGSSMLLAITIILDSGLRANKNMRTPMLISFCVTGVKLALNWVLIFGALGAPRLGLAGAGWATALSQLVGLVLFVWVIARENADSPTALHWRRVLSRNPLGREVVRIAMPGVGERVILNLGLLSYFWVLSNYYGTLAVAAYTVGVPLLSFSWIPGSGYAQSCATLVGQRLGARQPESAVRTGRIAALLALATALPLGALFALFRRPLAAIFTDDPLVVAALGPFMLALAIGQPFLQLHFTLGGAHRGAGDTWTPLIAAAIGNWIFRVPLACLAAIVWQLDVVWVWYALVVDHVARSALLLWSFRRGRWKTTLPDRPGRGAGG